MQILYKIFAYYLASIFLLTSCQSQKLELIDEANLKQVLLQSISIPPQYQQDTFLYRTPVPICKSEIEKTLLTFFEPRFEEKEYWKAFQKQLSTAVLVFNNDFHQNILEQCPQQDSAYVCWQAYEKDKVILMISGEIKTPKKLEIYERYSKNEDTYSIDKLFTYVQDKWQYEIIKQQLVEH